MSKTTQYCRYCGNCQISEMNGGPHCEVKDKGIAESTAKSVNICKDYVFIGGEDYKPLNNEEDYYLDFFAEKPYQPKKDRIKKSYKQEKLF